MADDPTRRGPWSELPWHDWEPTVSTLHRWLQIVGKVRTGLSPPLDHWWHSALSVTPRGVTTSTLHVGRRAMEIRFDFIRHELVIEDSDGTRFVLPLEPMPVARFYRDVMAGLHGLGIDISITTTPSELADATPYDVDEAHASYEPSHAEQLWRAFLDADRVMKAFQSGFLGKQSAVHLFWGSFDLAASRYAGSSESAIGWWPQIESPGPAFYAYTVPQPEGIASVPIRPPGARFDDDMRLFMLPNDVVRVMAEPDDAVLDFFESTYAAGADLAGWDRAALEPARRPGRHRRGPWSVLG